MGFRSTLVTEDIRITWPDWFVEKYQHVLWFRPDHTGVISSKHEAKTYGTLNDLAQDIQRAVDWEIFEHFTFVYLHECGDISRCIIRTDSVHWQMPHGWEDLSEPHRDDTSPCSPFPITAPLVKE